MSNSFVQKSLILKGPQSSKRGSPSFENKMPGLHHEILSMVLHEAAAEERRRSEICNTVRSMDDLKEELGKLVYHLKRTTLYYRY